MERFITWHELEDRGDTEIFEDGDFVLEADVVEHVRTGDLYLSLPLSAISGRFDGRIDYAQAWPAQEARLWATNEGDGYNDVLLDLRNCAALLVPYDGSCPDYRDLPFPGSEPGFYRWAIARKPGLVDRAKAFVRRIVRRIRGR